VLTVEKSVKPIGIDAAERSRSTAVIDASGPPNMAAHTPHPRYPIRFVAVARGSMVAEPTIVAHRPAEMARWFETDACARARERRRRALAVGAVAAAAAAAAAGGSWRRAVWARGE
jgi:hypothetical protein